MAALTDQIGSRALKPNPRLASFAPLVGTWKTSGSHPMMPGVALRGRSSFEWALGGAFLLWRSEMDDQRVPNGLAFIGSDDERDDCFMLYFDERGVSRKYDTSMRDGVWRWWRDDEKFSQRYAGTPSADGGTMVVAGEMRRNGGPWEPDLHLTYQRS